MLKISYSLSSFGMLMPGRSALPHDYRFGFNGKENDNELKGEGNSVDFGDRINDVRLGRFLSIDPLSNLYPYWSPYLYAGNNPIKFIDIEGNGPSEIKTNIMIIIPTTADEIKNALQYNNTDQGCWRYIVANNLAEANKTLQEYLGNQKADNIVIDSHGGGGGFLYANNSKNGGVIGKNFISPSAIRKGKMASDVKGLKGIMNSVKKDGNIVFTACKAGEGDVGLDLGKILQKFAPDANIFLSEQYVNGAVNEEGQLIYDNKNPHYELDPVPMIDWNHNDGTYVNSPQKDGFKVFKSDGTVVNLKKDGVHSGNISLDSTTGVNIDKKEPKKNK